MSLVQAPKAPSDETVVLANIRWSTYEALLEDLGPRRGKRILYDRGTLEIMVTSPFHERISYLIDRLIGVLTLELGIAIAGFLRTTWRREDLQRGFEADACYYIASEPLVRGREDLDLPRDPPPDLILEVDISSSSVEREGVYAAFGVRELWRFDGSRVRFFALRGRSDTEGPPPQEPVSRPYVEVERSLAFPLLAPADLDRFLALRTSMDDTSLMARFRDWVRDDLAKR
jgi:Uma2 family endonuclease